MSDPKQDEVPLPDTHYVLCVEGDRYSDDFIMRDLFGYSEEHLIAYGNARARAATERAAQVCSGLRSKERATNDTREFYRTEGWNGALSNAAIAILADTGIKGDGR